MKNLLQKVSANPENPNWNNIIKRQNSLYKRENEIRSEFERDYTRIINSKAYRRLKHKTQVFFSPENDHICTRIEHVTLVESISYTIAKYFGLNTELTKAIATAHDIGHSPFGHQGEKIISELSKDFIQKPFWHEKNGLEFVDKVELLETPEGKIQPLDLTYGVRDGIISHCGEINENGLKPRTEYIDLYEYEHPNQYAPYTWEGCVVKIADKLSYLGRDIEDAITLGILDKKLKELHEVLKLDKDVKINNTVILNMFIKDLCENSSLENGLCFSDEKFEMLNNLKEFNYKNIYLSEKTLGSVDYFELVLNKLFWFLSRMNFRDDDMKKICPVLADDFNKWLKEFFSLDINHRDIIISDNEFLQAVIYYIAGMTDNFAIETYNKIISF
ncbi:MAG: deoxyguanosinetriphosphate triphosphohydrolase family protein [Clostridia bacterium]